MARSCKDLGTLIFYHILLMCPFFISCSKKEKKKEVTTTIRVQKIIAEKRHYTRSFSGIIAPTKKATLSFAIPGKIAYLPLHLGQEVKKGEILAKIDDTDHRLELSKVEAEQKRHRSELDLSQKEFQRNKDLLTTKTVSESSYDFSLRALLANQASLLANSIAISLAQRQLDYCVIRAPFDGVIADIFKENHERVSSGEMITMITSKDSFHMEVGIPEALINQLSVGDTAVIYFDNDQENTLEGFIQEIGVMTTPTSTYKILVKFLNTTSKIHAGMVGYCVLTVPRKEDERISLPLSTIVGREEDRYVWLYQPQTKTVTKQPVLLGDLIDGKIIVKKGVKEGDLIVKERIYKLYENMAVTLIGNDDE